MTDTVIPRSRFALIYAVAEYLAGVEDARVLNCAWAKLFDSEGRYLGEVSPRTLLLFLLDDLHTVDVFVESGAHAGSEPVDISDLSRVEFYIG